MPSKPISLSPTKPPPSSPSTSGRQSRLFKTTKPSKPAFDVGDGKTVAFVIEDLGITYNNLPTVVIKKKQSVSSKKSVHTKGKTNNETAVEIEDIKIKTEVKFRGNDSIINATATQPLNDDDDVVNNIDEEEDVEEDVTDDTDDALDLFTINKSNPIHSASSTLNKNHTQFQAQTKNTNRTRPLVGRLKRPNQTKPTTPTVSSMLSKKGEFVGFRSSSKDLSEFSNNGTTLDGWRNDVSVNDLNLNLIESDMMSTISSKLSSSSSPLKPQQPHHSTPSKAPSSPVKNKNIRTRKPSGKTGTTAHPGLIGLSPYVRNRILTTRHNVNVNSNDDAENADGSDVYNISWKSESNSASLYTGANVKAYSASSSNCINVVKTREFKSVNSRGGYKPVNQRFFDSTMSNFGML